MRAATGRPLAPTIAGKAVDVDEHVHEHVNDHDGDYVNEYVNEYGQGDE